MERGGGRGCAFGDERWKGCDSFGLRGAEMEDVKLAGGKGPAKTSMCRFSHSAVLEL